ncbi:MAG TPA: GDSL-type esterase/lipase family protein [Pyrinomonadaceae bacterium]|nr:GDSL-type esterase/lipase family protein [Pyrinomonadaceae bacterium]
MSAGRVVLLGDSVFDNAAYVGGGPDVVAQLRAALPEGWRASLLAVDGSVTSGVAAQLRRLPADATHLVVSAGGNDALGQAGLLEERAGSMAEALDRLARVAERFERDYREMLGGLLGAGLPAAVCTVYYPRFPEPLLQRLAVAALAHFNDVIVRAAASEGLPLVDLRLVCGDDADYANPIEPSARGGEKIARAVARLVAEHDFARGRTEVFTN